jgi:FAD-dependent urate hydroxylase
MPAGEGFLQWWFDHPWKPSDPPPDSPVIALRKRFEGWAAPVREVLEQVDDDDLGFFPHFGHLVPRTWGKGAATLVGDAAHSMPPTRAQGANQALEDAWALAKVLRDGSDPARALRSYERARAPKAGLVSRQALKEDTNQYRPWRSRLLPNAVAARLYTRWLGQVSNYLV